MKKRMTTAVVLFTCAFHLLSGQPAGAETITKPYTFSSGAPARATEVNENFDTLYNQVNRMGQGITVKANDSNVGIGTTSPTEKLEIFGGNLRVTGNESIAITAHSTNDNSVTNIQQSWSSGTDFAYLQSGILGPNVNGTSSLFGLGGDAGAAYLRVATNNSANVSYMAIGTQVSKPLHFGTSNAARMTIDSSGNVGIGTTAPSTKLHISSGDVRITNNNPQLDFYTADTLKGRIYSEGNTFAMQAHAGDLRIYANTGSNITLENGNVGIGTTSPTEKLDVAGNIKSSGTVTATSFVGDGSGLTGISSSSGKPAYGASASAANDSVYVDASGNVGIGTTSPSYPLHISGTNPGLYIANPGGAAAWIQAVGSNSVDVGSIGAHPLRLLTDNNEKMRITTSGNVGIGTTTPNAPLQVHGNYGLLVSRSTNGSTMLSLIAEGSGNEEQSVLTMFSKNPNRDGLFNNSKGWQITAKGDAHSDTDSRNDLMFVYRENAPGNARVVFDNNGNVGIGTTSPGSKLDVAGDIRATQICDETGANCKDISTGWASAGADGHSLNSANDSVTDAVYVSNNGNVGIGTTSPDEKLTLYSGTHTYMKVKADAANYAGYRWDKGGIEKWTAYVGSNSDDLKFYNGGTETVTFQKNGNVGIGTTSPGQKLTVAGTIESTSGGIKFPDATTQTTAATYGMVCTDIANPKYSSNSIANLDISSQKYCESQGYKIGNARALSGYIGTVYYYDDQWRTTNSSWDGKIITSVRCCN